MGLPTLSVLPLVFQPQWRLDPPTRTMSFPLSPIWPQSLHSWGRAGSAETEASPADSAERTIRIFYRPSRDSRPHRPTSMTALREPRWQRRMWPVLLLQFAPPAPAQQSTKF